MTSRVRLVPLLRRGSSHRLDDLDQRPDHPHQRRPRDGRLRVPVPPRLREPLIEPGDQLALRNLPPLDAVKPPLDGSERRRERVLHFRHRAPP